MMSNKFSKSKNKNDCMNCYYCSDTCRECVGTDNIAKAGWICAEWKSENKAGE